MVPVLHLVMALEDGTGARLAGQWKPGHRALALSSQARGALASLGLPASDPFDSWGRDWGELHRWCQGRLEWGGEGSPARGLWEGFVTHEMVRELVLCESVRQELERVKPASLVWWGGGPFDIFAARPAGTVAALAAFLRATAWKLERGSGGEGGEAQLSQFHAS